MQMPDFSDDGYPNTHQVLGHYLREEPGRFSRAMGSF